MSENLPSNLGNKENPENPELSEKDKIKSLAMKASAGILNIIEGQERKRQSTQQSGFSLSDKQVETLEQLTIGKKKKRKK